MFVDSLGQEFEQDIVGTGVVSAPCCLKAPALSSSLFFSTHYAFHAQSSESVLLSLTHSAFSLTEVLPPYMLFPVQNALLISPCPINSQSPLGTT